MQLGDAETVGVEDHHDRRVRHVDAHLDHRRRHEHVELATPEPSHHVVLLSARHPAVHQPESQPLQLVGGQDGERLLADATSSFSESWISGHTTYAWRPAATSDRTASPRRGVVERTDRAVRDDR